MSMSQKQKSSLQECLQLLKQATHSLVVEKLPTKVILLMGSSKAGKTTLLYYLLGKPLKLVTNDLGVSVLQPEAIYHQAYIGTGYESTTVYPNIPTDCGVDDLIIIDMPGLDDTRPIYKLVNLYVLLQILQLVQEVHVCQVIEQLFIESDQLLEEIHKICNFINKKLLNTEGAMSFVITKVQDQQCLQKLDTTLEYLGEESQNHEIFEQLQTFRANKKYVFRSQQPKIDQGLELKQKIIEDSFFTVIDKQPQNFLSPTFCSHMIGENNLKEFQEYLQQLVSQAEPTIFQLVKLAASVLRCEYSQIIIFEKQESRSIQIAEYLAIKQFASAIELYQINTVNIPQDKLQQSEDPLLGKEGVLCYQRDAANHERLFRIFQFQQEYSLSQFMKHMAYVFEDSNNWYIIPRTLAESMQMSFKELAALLKILKLIDTNQLKPVIEKLLTKSEILQKVSQFYAQWHQISNNLLSNPNLPLLLQNKETKQAYSAYFGPITVKQSITYVCQYEQIRKREVKQVLSKHKASKINIFNKKITKLSIEEIQQLPNNTFSLEFILQKIASQPRIDLPFLKALISKASAILSRFSYYQQAILFLLAISDLKTAGQLLQLGIIYSEVSAEFVREIMLKYYLNGSASHHHQICLCYRFLFQSVVSQQQFDQLYTQFTLESLKRQSLEKTAPKENIPQSVQLFFIEPILKERQRFLKVLKQLQSKFEQSLCSAIRSSSTAISQIMK